MEEERSPSIQKMNKSQDEISQKKLKKSKSELDDETPIKNFRSIKVSSKNIKYILESFDEIKKKEEKISMQSFEISTLVIFANYNWFTFFLD